MILAEEKKQIEMRDIIEDRIAERFPFAFEINDKKCFKANQNTYFVISSLRWDGDDVILAEYADSEFEARKGLFGEDGDMFYLDEMSENEIIQAIIKEVEQ